MQRWAGETLWAPPLRQKQSTIRHALEKTEQPVFRITLRLPGYHVNIRCMTSASRITTMVAVKVFEKSQ
ncbi:hypothetical protein J1614_006318 [Plenodomus biglobosus]|nr:hypothetical protein J1614_006318 [Plenodomus biglobosus]